MLKITVGRMDMSKVGNPRTATWNISKLILSNCDETNTGLTPDTWRTWKEWEKALCGKKYNAAVALVVFDFTSDNELAFGYAFATQSQIYTATGWKSLNFYRKVVIVDLIKEELALYNAWLKGNLWEYTIEKSVPGEDDSLIYADELFTSEDAAWNAAKSFATRWEECESIDF